MWVLGSQIRWRYVGEGTKGVSGGKWENEQKTNPPEQMCIQPQGYKKNGGAPRVLRGNYKRGGPGKRGHGRLGGGEDIVERRRNKG